MEDKEESEIALICLLPEEIITTILSYIDLRDAVNLSSSCKRFYYLLGHNGNCYWRKKYFELLPVDFHKLVNLNSGDNIDWLDEVRGFYTLKKGLNSELTKMSRRYYWRETEVSLEDFKPIFKLATNKSIDYYYTLYILQEIVIETTFYIENNTCVKPLNTLTVLYYTKLALRYLVQTFLCMKWVGHITQNELTPEIEVNFFLQWIDTENFHTDDDMDETIQYLVSEVKKILRRSGSRHHTQRQILYAISEEIFHNQKIIASSLDTYSRTLDIVKVVNEKRGSVITVGTIYQAVAKGLGVYSELNAFSDHFFLEWQCEEDGDERLYTIDLSTGELRPKRHCPYSHQRGATVSQSHRYHPGSMVQFLYSIYMQSKGTVEDWEYQNASLIFAFLGSHQQDNHQHNPFKDFFLFLSRYAAAPSLNPHMNIKCLTQQDRDLIVLLSGLNDPQESYDFAHVKKRKSNLKYAVGMVCYHIHHYYTFVISGWEVDEERKPRVNEEYDCTQPIYTVVTEDQCIRFIPQEKMKQLTKPHRIKAVEDILGRDFTHFDGYAYVSNDEKLKEYPDDRCVVEEYINRCFTLND